MNNLEIKLAEGMPVVKEAKHLTLSSRTVTLLDDIKEPERIPIPKEIQKELRFIGMKALSDFTY